MSLLSVQGLSRHFDGLRAVDGVDLQLAAGEVRALIGPNGAGKSTLTGMIVGRIAASAGQVIFDGRDITHWRAHRRIRAGIGHTFQIVSVFAGLSVAENAALAARRHLRGRAAEAAAQAALAQVGLAGRAAEVAGTLSHGHQRLLELAMALAQHPRLLILDEPTQGLSEAEIAGVTRLMRDLAGHTTLLLIEHNMDVVMTLAGHITVMDGGRVLAEGTPAAIRADARVQAAYLGGGNA